MRLVFAGTPDAAVPSLRRLADSSHDVCAVVTRQDAPVGRKRTLTPSPIARAAVELGIPVLKTNRLDAEATARVQALRPDLGVIVAYGGLVREPLLSTPDRGWINLHFSLLPRWRGAAPVQRSLMAGEEITGASVFQLVAELDAGDVFDEVSYEVPATATAGDVLDALAESGAELLERVVDAIGAGTAVAAPQTGEPTYAAKLTTADGRIDWHVTAPEVLARIRGVTPDPGAFTTVDGARVKITRAGACPIDTAPLPPGAIATASGTVVIGTGTDPVTVSTVQPAGKGAMAAVEWWRGLRSDHPQAGT